MRYFIVYYQAQYEGNTFNGNISFEVGCFFKSGEVESFLKQEHGFDDAIMTGFNEISHRDYLQWNNKDETV